jgi:hypothetical protein
VSDLFNTSRGILHLYDSEKQIITRIFKILLKKIQIFLQYQHFEVAFDDLKKFMEQEKMDTKLIEEMRTEFGNVQGVIDYEKYKNELMEEECPIVVAGMKDIQSNLNTIKPKPKPKLFLVLS